jgi:glycosyltransferase involved in cell wall biosynthesis
MPRPARVLHLVKGLGAGGTERLIVSLADVADRSAVTYEVAYLLPDLDHLVAELTALAVPTHLIGQRGISDPRWPARLRSLARRHDVVHLHSPAVSAIARPALRTMRTGPAVVSTEHNVWPSRRALTLVANAATTWLDEARWAVAPEVVDSMWAPWRARAEVLVHGVPLASLRRLRDGRDLVRAEQGWAEDDVVVAVVANLRTNKDYPTLFAAAARALELEPRLRFVSIGQGPLQRRLAQDLGRHDLGDRFAMLGYQRDPPRLLAGADIFALSSRHEGLPISLLEAMAVGLPPVVTAVGGSVGVVTHDVTGVLVAPRSEHELARTFVRLAGDPGLRRRLGDAAATRAEDFDIVHAARSLEARYQQLARRGRD